MIFKKGVININFSPPGSVLPNHLKWERHILFDHYKPIAQSGAVLVSNSIDDLLHKMMQLLDNPKLLIEKQKKTLDNILVIN